MISIIVPVYNVENFLPKCIESLIRQTYKDIEIILIDDGSLDKSMKLLKKYKKGNKKIHSYKQLGFGPVAAQQFALTKAKGKYKGGKNKLSDEQVAELNKLADQGLPIAKIARQFNITRPTVYGYLKKQAH